MTWRDFSKELDSIYRKSYFLFSKETYEFIDKFRKAVIELKLAERKDLANESAKVKEAREFLLGLLEGQALAKNFPEIKIDFY